MQTPPVSRRTFLKSSTIAGAAVTVSHLVPASLWGESRQTTAAWADKAMRWAQLTLVEDDPGKFDPAFWFDYFRRTASDGVCLSGGGCVAYYPTEVPFHHRSKWLNDRDVLGELIAGCRKLGMVVLVRTDPHATYDDVQQAHPDWIAVDAEGKQRRHWSSPDMWVTCALGPYTFEFMTDVHKEIMSRYRVDGLFLNRWEGSGQCYCQHCVTNFKAASGYDLPRTDDPQDPARRAYIIWRQQRLLSLLDIWDAEIRKINPNSSVIPNNGSGALISGDAIELSQRCPMLVADRQARHGVSLPWAFGKTAKEYRATMGNKPVAGLFGVGVEEAYRWKDSVNSGVEIRIWALDGIANGMRPWVSKFSGTLHDERWLKPVEEVFQWTKSVEPYLRDREPIANVGLVYSQQNAWFYGGPRAQAKVEDYSLGWYQALIESRIPFEMVHDRLLDTARTRKFKTLILPNIATLSDAQCTQLRAFVNSGGSVIATYETSLYDEWGVRRKDFGLADMFGVSWSGRGEGPMMNSYLRLEHEAVPNSPFLRGLEDAPRIINGVNRLEVELRADFGPLPITLIPSYPDLPMEEVFPRQSRTSIGEVFARSVGKGRVVYFPWDIDRTFWEVLNEDHLKLLRNAVEFALGTKPAIEVTGPGLLDITLWRKQNAVIIHLVNLTNPMAMKGPYREFLPVGEQRIAIHPSYGAVPRSAKGLVSGKTLGSDREAMTTTYYVPSILDHEMVVVDL